MSLVDTLHPSPSVTLYVTAILTAPNRRRAEIEAEQRLISAAFGTDAVLMHHPDGAPYIEGSPLFISLSHSPELCVLAVASHPVGVDVEATNRLDKTARLAARIAHHPGEESHCPDALHFWTAKEAWFKALHSLPTPLTTLPSTPTALSDIDLTALPPTQWTTHASNLIAIAAWR